jgi:hypothetical protein
VAAQAAAPSDACNLLTDAEVAEVLGVKVDAGHHPNVDDPKQCYWRAADMPTGVAKSINVYIIDSANFGSMKKATIHGTESPVPGLGDDSYYSSGFVPNLSLRKGTVYVRLMARATDSTSTDPANVQFDQDMAAEKKLAASVLKRL